MSEVIPSAPVFIQLLDGFKVVCKDAPSAPNRFRSRTAEHLLTCLALRIGHTISKAEIQDMLWPDSDGDRQAQNLRRAISDVRQVLEGDCRGSPLLLAERERLWLDKDRIQTDVREFKSLTDGGLEGVNAERNLRAALQLYTGPLLPGSGEAWIEIYRMELEETFSQAVELLISILLESDRHDEALRIGRHAVIAAPLREDVHIALVRAYASAGLPSEAIRQFEELESLLVERWGEPPSPKSLAAFGDLNKGANAHGQKSVQSTQGHHQESPGGAMQARSPFYIVRECDRILKRGIERSEGTILIHGTRQVGKTSLLGRVLNETRSAKCRVAVTDFQVLNRTQLASGDALCRALAYGFATQLGIKLDLPVIWNEWIGPNSNLDTVVDLVLTESEGQIVWAMDEADLLFGTEYADDFFGLVRGWHNRRAMDEAGRFNRLTVVISYATEAHLFIKDVNQSPFNVGLRIPVRDFNLVETRELSNRYGTKVTDREIQQIVEVTGGQPFLTRKVFDAIANGLSTIKEIATTSAAEDGLFSEHLKRLLYVATLDDQTKAEVIRFLHNKPLLDPKTQLRLIAGGMLVRNQDGNLAFRVPAYKQFLTRHLIG